ncbi:MAG: alpha-glucan family phosphorylase [Sedimentisphaerales bacterium]|nr:alpha-glucan family phosphorylase [Sedimentisphaerales bacterium]
MAFRNIFVYPRYPENLEKLYVLAYDLWTTWNYDAIRLFYRVDAHLFQEARHNPVRLLLSLSQQRIDELAQDEGFLFELNEVWENYQEYMSYDPGTDAGRTKGLGADDIVAYFSMEFGLHECIPIYGGGLGILAGDFLKAASDMALRVIGVGLIYKYGYFTQRIDLDGMQEELFAEFDNHLIPVRELRDQRGEKAYIDMTILGAPLRVKLWEITIGRTHLILLDTDIEDNPTEFRDITHELYVADREKRLRQELVLGIGGVRALEALDIHPTIYHINEGHSAFLILARLRQLMAGGRLGFAEAKAMIRASTVFTTHTPVKAGNETFDLELVQKYLDSKAESFGVSFEDIAPYGLVGQEKKVFSLPAFAIRFASHVNAVSKLHRDVSRNMWASLYPNRQPQEIPIDYVTNGVHRSWLSQPFTELLNRHVGPAYVHCAGNRGLSDKIHEVPDEEIWEAHRKNKQNLVTFVRRKLARDLAAKGYIQTRIQDLTRLLHPEYLTVVYARRFARYKRATLVLKDKGRLAKILTSTTKPVQLLFAGKAHPADRSGKDMIREIITFAKDNHIEDRVIFLEDYDMNVARHLAWGADVWLNTPIRLNEASGTSGMKAAINGVLNCSVLDGWWPEAYDGKNGWAITAGQFYEHSELQETAEANQIYDLLEAVITELYYERSELGIPTAWVEMMRRSIATACRDFNMNRVLAEYSDKFYVPAKRQIGRLSADNHAALRKAVQGELSILEHWDKVAIRDVSTSVDKKDRVCKGERVEVRCTVDFAGAAPELFGVELYLSRSDSDGFRVLEMAGSAAEGSSRSYTCSFDIAEHGLLSMNVRVRPADLVLQDLHPELIKWAQ